MAHLVNMALSESERKTMLGQAVDPDDGPKFPFGLTVHLDDASIEKLGIDPLPKAGTVMTLTATVTADRVETVDRADGTTDREITLQITDMALDTGAEPKDRAQNLFGRSDSQQA